MVVGHPHVDANNVERILGEGYRFLMAAPVRSYAALEKGLKLAGGRRLRCRATGTDELLFVASVRSRSGLFRRNSCLGVKCLDSRPAWRRRHFRRCDAREPAVARRRQMRQWGKRECRTRSGSPWRALGLVRSAKRIRARRIGRVAESVACCHCAAIRCCALRTALRRGRRPLRMPRRSTPIVSALACCSTGTRSRRSRSRSAFSASRSSPRSCWCARAAASPRSRRRRATRRIAPAPRSTAPMRCCCPSRKSSSPGRRPPTSPRSSAIRRW